MVLKVEVHLIYALAVDEASSFEFVIVFVTNKPPTKKTMLRNHHLLYRLQDISAELCSNVLNTLWLKKRPEPGKDTKLDGKTIIVTGCNRGIGKYIVADLAKRGTRVIMAVRNLESGESARDEILSEIPNENADIIIMKVDMSSLSSIDAFVEKVTKEEVRLDYLIQNAGMVAKVARKTDEGFESTMAVNYFGVVYLTMKLMDKMMATSSDPRVFLMSSLAHHETKSLGWENLQLTPDFNPFDQYGRSKLALMLFGRELIKRTHSKGLKVYLVDPGISMTDIFDDVPTLQYVLTIIGHYLFCLRTVKESADSMILSVLSNKEEYDFNHYYFCDGKVKVPSSGATDDDEAKNLWDATSRSLGLNQMETI